MRIFSKLKKISTALFKIKYNLYDILIKSSAKIPKVVIRKSKHGIFTGFENDYLFKSAISSGSNEAHFFELISKILRPSDICLDLGGNIGTHAILMSNIVIEGKVYTFESQSLVFSILQNNLLLNNCHNVFSYRFAISDKNFETISMQPFSFDGQEINNGNLRVDSQSNSGDYTLTRTLDSFKFEKVNFIKIDIQGSEFKALCGAKNLLLHFRPILFLEIEEQQLKSLGTSTKELIEKLFSLDYALFRINTSYPCDHICVPIENANKFEKKYKDSFSFSLSKKIYGKTVNVNFRKKKDQNYNSLKIS